MAKMKLVEKDSGLLRLEWSLRRKGRGKKAWPCSSAVSLVSCTRPPEVSTACPLSVKLAPVNP
ncbi:unnamed protein product [Spirodela intermedia]|uniref:Uncharacterized protein n=1 Tax=Spirodela intermedia TaxID=51605 RepID=A0A7I8K0M2_SPIIN|nr:unnamed protein product [Spirodela intermedia]